MLEHKMDWYEITDRFHAESLKNDGDLAVLPEEWQRELAALWRLEADVNNGGYLQFLQNWGLQTYDHALAGLRKIGANKMASVVEECQRLVAQYTDASLPEYERFRNLMPNPILNRDGTVTTPPPSPIPDNILQMIDDLSYHFMDYPDDIATLGIEHYASHIPGKT
jgi:hypothetical protein